MEVCERHQLQVPKRWDCAVLGRAFIRGCTLIAWAILTAAHRGRG